MDIISKLKNEGVLKLYHDYRSGSLVDLSGNDNDGTPTSSKILNKKGNKTSYGATYQYIEVDDSSELNLTEGTLCVFGDFKTMSGTIGIMMAKRDSTSGLTFQLGRNTHGTLLDFHTTASASIAISANANCYSINFKTGSKPVVYTDGKLTGEMSAVSTVPTTAAKVYISGSPASGTWNDYESTYGAALMISRKLTATEHAQLFAQLQNTKYPSKVTAISKANTQVSNKPYISEQLLTDGDMEASGVAAWSSHQATLTKETNNPHYGTQCLRVTATAATANLAYQQVISPNSTYRVTGWARSDGTNVPLVGDWVLGSRWTGTTSTDWQYFDLTFTPTSSLATRLTLGSYGADGNYVEFDDVSLTQVEPLYAGYNMKPVSNKIIDQSGNGFDGTITDAVYEKDKVMGDTLVSNSTASRVAFPAGLTGASFGSSFTISLWVKTTNTGYRWFVGEASGDIFLFGIGGTGYIHINMTGITITGGSQFTGLVNDGLWHHCVMTYDGTTASVYVDGSLSQAKAATGSPDNVGTLNLFRRANFTAEVFTGNMAAVKFHKRVLSATEISADYNKVKNTGVSFKTDWGVKESVAIEGGVEDKQLSNSPFKFSTTTGRFKIISEDDIKAIACTTSGFIYHKVDCSEKEAAYGTWEFSVRGGTGSATTLYFISDTKTIAGGVSTYYAISYYGDDEYFKVSSYDTTTTSTKLNTGGHSYLKDTIHKVRITRDAAGIFHIYINGSLAAVSSGANTWTDNTVAITGKYMVVGQNASNNELFLSDKTGGHSLIKRNLP